MLPRACGTPRSQRAGWTEPDVGGGEGSKHGDGASGGHGEGRRAARAHSVPPTPEDGERGARCALLPAVLGPSLSASRGPLTTPNCSEVSPQRALSQDDPSPAGAGVASVSSQTSSRRPGSGVSPTPALCALLPQEAPAAPTTRQGRTLWPGSPSACSCTSSGPFSGAARGLLSTLRHRGDARRLSFPGFCSGREAAAPSPARLRPAGTSHAAWTQAGWG